ncbi:MAG TPA: hypothetical protein VHN99_02330 [Deinococcales bacterium]|nr:hypothetical protein [Deinococcales bacterium]
MAYKTVEQVIAANPHYKSASLYNAIVRAIKTGPLRGKALPLNRNDEQAKFMLPKAVARTGRTPEREVTNFVIIDVPAFDEWFDSMKEDFRATRPIGKAQIVMPRLEAIMAGHYSEEQLRSLAQHVANKRYGSHRSGRRAEKAATAAPATPKRGRPARKAAK